MSQGDHISGQSNKPLSRPPHGLSGEQVLRELASDAAVGLDPEEVLRRLGEYGPNELEQKKGVQPLKIFLEQVFNAMTLVSPDLRPSGGITAACPDFVGGKYSLRE